MEIRNLKNTGLDKIVECLLESFKNYAVPVPTSLDYWDARYKGARVDYEFSYGAFENGKMVGFIINGIDQIQGQLTAFNTGTGVVEAFRGQKIVDQLYNYAMPFFKQKGITQCQLEVIQTNKRAIRVYERIGFEVIRGLKCFKGELNTSPSNMKLHKTDFEQVKQPDIHYSWDFKNKAIKILSDQYETYSVINEEEENIGYFVINAAHNSLAQLESSSDNYNDLLKGIGKISNEIRIINVDEKLSEKIAVLQKFGLVNNIDQFEMEMKI